MHWYKCRALTLAVICCASLMSGAGKAIETLLDDDPPDAITIQPPLEAGSGTGSFEWLDHAINDNIFDGAIGSVQVRCRDTCLKSSREVSPMAGIS